MRIAYFGDSSSATTSSHRAAALRRLGHVVDVFDVARALRGRTSFVAERVHYRTGYRFLQPGVLRFLRGLDLRGYDLAWVCSGERYGEEALELIKRTIPKLLLYVVDDVTGTRDGNRFAGLRRCIGKYDLCVVRRTENVDEFRRLGAKKVTRIFMSFDEAAHAPFADIDTIPEHLRSEVAFIGTWMREEGRDQFVARLLELGVPVTVWGNRWERSRLWRHVKDAYRGPALSGRNYVAAIQGAKVCLGLMSKGNRDLHTRRSAEIPYADGLLCAERTAEHLQMFEDGEEAVFWETPEECARQCHTLLEEHERREQIRAAGRRRIVANRLGNEDVCQDILDQL